MTETKKTGVNEILAKLISDWPSLYRSRLSALSRVFSYYDNWSGGFPHHDYPDRDESLDQPLDETLDGSDARSYRNSAILRKRHERMEDLFIRENAEMIAAAESGKFRDFTSTPDFSTYYLNRMPLETMNADWRAALEEFCRAILLYSEDKLRHRKALQGTCASYIENEVSRLNSSKAAAQEALSRLGKSGEQESRERAALIQKLHYEAEALGFTLTPMKTAS
jgi:hypothetical protein